MKRLIALICILMVAACAAPQRSEPVPEPAKPPAPAEPQADKPAPPEPPDRVRQQPERIPAEPEPVTVEPEPVDPEPVSEPIERRAPQPTTTTPRSSPQHRNRYLAEMQRWPVG